LVVHVRPSSKRCSLDGVARCRDSDRRASGSSTSGEEARARRVAWRLQSRRGRERTMAARSWRFDLAHSSINFVVRHMLVSRVCGAFTRFGGELSFDEAAPEAAKVSARIDAASIDTREPRRDEHLRSIDFLDAARFPHLHFRSQRVERIDAAAFKLVGDLTLRGTTREVVLDVDYGGRMRDPSGVERIGFTARTTIDRKVFGVTFNQVLDTGGLALGNKIDIVIDVEAIGAGRSATEADAERRALVAGLDGD
jgi:polyisoprenoid-binding protein YceI